MFDSGITAQSFITGLQSEVDVSATITLDTYATWLSGTEQLLYSDIIREQKRVVLDDLEDSHISMSAIVPETGEKQPVFEDISKVYHGETELTKALSSTGPIFPNTYWKDGAGFSMNAGDVYTLDIIYHVRPAIKTVVAGNVAGNVMLPYEFLFLIAAKVRGEAYKIANEDALSAKWLNDYNAGLDTFAAWVAARAPWFGEG